MANKNGKNGGKKNNEKGDLKINENIAPEIKVPEIKAEEITSETESENQTIIAMEKAQENLTPENQAPENQVPEIKVAEKKVSEMTEEEIKVYLKQIKKKEENATLINTAKNHLDKLQNNLFDLQENGVDISEFLILIQPIRNRTKTNARLAKEALMAQLIKEQSK